MTFANVTVYIFRLELHPIKKINLTRKSTQDLHVVVIQCFKNRFKRCI